MNVLLMEPDWHHGYPEPSAGFGYIQQTFDMQTYCPCGLGKRQVAPFRMKREPRWGRRSILQLHWEFETFFVTPAAWERCFRPFGVEKMPVLNHRTGEELASVVQLRIPEETEAHVEGLRFRACERCGRRKYMPIDGCRFPGPKQVPAPLFHSIERFNDGAFRLVYVRMDLYGAIYAAGLKGAVFTETHWAHR
ncbi:MAG: hypothetical protein JNK87_30210 [Bryobacterales bacterium]|nr:hypothetical protein [Bryobacterales bacterium]